MSIFDPKNILKSLLPPGVNKPTGAAKTPEKLKIEHAPVKQAAPGENATAIDARIQTRQFPVCEFKGSELSQNKLRKCKFFKQSPGRSCCIWYEEDITTADYLDLGICRLKGDS